MNINLHSPTFYLSRGIAYRKGEQYPEAIADYSQAIQLNPFYAEAYQNRGNIYSDLGKYPEAIADYNQEIKLNPEEPSGYVLRGNAFLSLGNYSAAKQDLQQAANLYLQQGRPDLAQQMLDVIQLLINN